MKRRFTKLPIASIAVVVGSLLIGLSMSPAGAQSGLTNGQVTVRSDGAVYLIENGKRRWVATVQITDDELNAYPEAEPIYAGLAPFGSASAGTAATKTGTGTSASSSPTAAAKTSSGSTTTKVASKTGATTGPSASTTAPASSSPTTASTGTTATTGDTQVAPGQVAVDPASGADVKDPNDPTLAAAPATVDPTGKAQPINSTTCPDSHMVKGGVDKFYSEPDRPDYANVQVEACFRTGKDARDSGYTESKKRT